MCVAGDVCLPRWRDAVCREPGGADVPEPCRHNGDCLSGICVTEVCLPPCDRNEDCPAGWSCEETRTLGGEDTTRLACMVRTRCEECGPQEFCASGNCAESCRLGADCGTGHCMQVYGDWMGAWLFGQCVDDSPCEVQELHLPSFGPDGGGFCVLRQTCWHDEDCDVAGGYVCLTELGASGSSGLCGREVVAGPDEEP